MGYGFWYRGFCGYQVDLLSQLSIKLSNSDDHTILSWKHSIVREQNNSRLLAILS